MNDTKALALKEFLTIINKSLTATIEEQYASCEALVIVCVSKDMTHVASNVNAADMGVLLAVLADQIAAAEQAEGVATRQ